MLLSRAIDDVVASVGADLIVSTSTLESRCLIEAVKPPKSAAS
jgi:UTP:GlnB (protein PII) uridylyltransferase